MKAWFHDINKHLGLCKQFVEVKIQHILQSQNLVVDLLAREAHTLITHAMSGSTVYQCINKNTIRNITFVVGQTHQNDALLQDAELRLI